MFTAPCCLLFINYLQDNLQERLIIFFAHFLYNSDGGVPNSF